MTEEFFYSDHNKPPLDSSASDIRTMALLKLLGITEDEQRACAIVLAAHAQSTEELREWLQMCGLYPYESVEHRDRTAVASRLEYVRPL